MGLRNITFQTRNLGRTFPWNKLGVESETNCRNGNGATSEYKPRVRIYESLDYSELNSTELFADRSLQLCPLASFRKE